MYTYVNIRNTIFKRLKKYFIIRPKEEDFTLNNVKFTKHFFLKSCISLRASLKTKGRSAQV